jgi:hypothetical protein
VAVPRRSANDEAAERAVLTNGPRGEPGAHEQRIAARA